MNIWQIQQDLLDIFNELEENGGELTPELEEKLAVTQEDFKNKVKSYGEVIKSLKGEIDTIDKETARLKKQNRRLERKMKGLCVRCAAPNDNPTSYLCKACSEKERLERIRHKEKYKAAGKCLNCGKPVEIYGESKCPACKRKESERRKKKYSDLKDQRICTRCGQQLAEKGKTKCWDCLEKDAEMSVKYREGLSKGRLEERRKRVRTAMKKRRIKAREDGICIVCLQRRSVKGKSMCFDCLARQKRREADLKIIRGT